MAGKARRTTAQKAQAALEKAQSRYQRAADADAKAQARAAETAREVAEAYAEVEYARLHPALREEPVDEVAETE